MICPYQNICGGCPLRSLSDAEYQQHKIARFEKIISNIKQENIYVGEPIFIADGLRRRAEFTFRLQKGKLLFGFNAQQSHDIIDTQKCLALTPTINDALPAVREFLQNFMQIPLTQKVKNKITTSYINKGEIWLTQAANGLDILLETEAKISLQHRMEICDFANNNPTVIRFSVGAKNTRPETVLEKTKPYIDVCGRHVFIPAGTFLQASQEGQNALTSLVLKYTGNTTGNIADLFCGVGTFSYPLAANIKNKITSVDSSAELLDNFQQTVNYFTIPNIKIIKKNLFKYPLEATELKEFELVIFDPPRAGAALQTAQFKHLPTEDKPQKVIAISCNPHTFINDANSLLESGYELKEITMVDQFVYAEHFELVALFEKQKI
ncbi:MAG: class I SAM-dependent RNA methyltransferase [Alphaproteobacteria bacterium]|nr:class I SAM-dependent RNA methyltransferase [Alphaproteobacteria bacterium]